MSNGNSADNTGVDGTSAAITNRQLTWRSRRGMLELELFLLPFVRSKLAGLSASDREAYARLLEHDDWDIFEWLQGRWEPQDQSLTPILEQIRLANTA